MTERKPLPTMILVAMAIVPLLLLVAYVGGYFLLGRYEEDPFGGDGFRVFPQQWLATVYEPAGWVEGKIRGCQANLMVVELPDTSDPFK